MVDGFRDLQDGEFVFACSYGGALGLVPGYTDNVAVCDYEAVDFIAYFAWKYTESASRGWMIQARVICRDGRMRLRV